LVDQLPSKIWQVFQDSEGKYWFGSNGDGVFVYNGRQLVRYDFKDGLLDDAIRGIQEDKRGNVFVETPRGVNKYDGGFFYTIPVNSSSNDRWVIDSQDLWFNCNGNPREVYRYDGKVLNELALPRQNLDQAFGIGVTGVPFAGMNNSPYSVYGIDIDKDGNLWLGTVSAGAFRYDGASFLWFGEKELSTLPDGRVPGVRSLLQDKDGYFWLSNFISKYSIFQEDSIATYRKFEGIDSTERLDLGDLPYFNSGLVDQEGNLWMTSYSGGVWHYDGEHLSNFPVHYEETEALLVSIYEDREGRLWLGSDNLGPFTKKGDTFERFDPRL